MLAYDRAYSRHHGDPAQQARWLSAYDRQQAEILWTLVKHTVDQADLTPRILLEVGCAGGASLARMARDIGGSVSVGFDVRFSALARARQAHPAMQPVQSEGIQMPFRDGVFDLAFQFTTFSSIPDRLVKIRIAREILRVLRPGGLFLWYDFRYSNPSNPFTVAESRRDIRRYFPGVDLHLRSLMVIPQIGRAIYPTLPRLMKVLDRVSVLHSHYFGWFVKR